MQKFDDSSAMDSNWVLRESGAVLAKQPYISEEERDVYGDPSQYLENKK